MADSSDNATQAPAVDETPISPSRPDPQRKNSLEQHLKHRPVRQELVKKNILPASNAAPGLIAQQKEVRLAVLSRLGCLGTVLTSYLAPTPAREAYAC